MLQHGSVPLHDTLKTKIKTFTYYKLTAATDDVTGETDVSSGI